VADADNTKSSGRIPVILNPAAKSEGAASLSEQISDFSHQVELHETTGPDDARKFAKSLALEGRPLIVAAGGDGTVNEVATGISTAREESDSEINPVLGILPTGTMNVFARELGIPCNDPLEAWAAIQSGLRVDVDLWMADDRPFLQMAGVGLDAEIIRRTTWQSKKMLGPLSYLFTGISLVGRTPPKLRVEIPGREPLHGCAIVVGNGALYGGAIPFFPGASNSDGMLEILVFRKLDAGVLLQLGGAIAAHEYCDSDHIVYERADDFTIHSDGPTEEPMEVDGELGGETPVHFTHAKYRVRVARPPDPRPQSLPQIADEHLSS